MMLVASSGSLTGAVPLDHILQAVLFVSSGLGATLVVFMRRPARQVLLLSIYGLLLSVLFLTLQAPDVTLSELTIGAVVLPMLLLLSLAKMRKQRE